MNLDPMQGFQIGQAIGSARSPVTELGQTVKNIVENARKKGLLEAQSQFQTAGANQNAILKEGREEARLKLPTTTKFVGATDDQDRDVTHLRGETVKAMPKPAPLTLAQELSELQRLRDTQGGDTKGGGKLGLNSILSPDDLDSKASAYLVERGKPDVPENRKAIIERRLVK